MENPKLRFEELQELEDVDIVCDATDVEAADDVIMEQWKDFVETQGEYTENKRKGKA